MAKSRPIAMITDDFIPARTGVGVHVQKMGRELAARGHQVVVVTARGRGQPAEEVWEGVKVYRIFSLSVAGFPQALPTARSLRRIFLQNSIGVVHCHYLGFMMLRALRAAKDMGLPTVLTTHMTVDHLTQPFFMRPWRPLLSRVIARIYEKFNDVISVSAAYARQVERFRISSRVHYISNPVDFDGTETPAAEPSERFRVFFVGRLNPEKNVPFLLRAFRLFLDRGGSAELWIAGQGSQEKELRELTAALALGENVKFLGQVVHNDLPALYAACDAFVLPSVVEMQPLVALEAMRFKRPVIVTHRIVSAREMIDEGKNGFIVDAGAPEALADRLAQLRADPALRQRLGEAGFKKSAAYTIPAVLAALEGVYQSIDDDSAPRFDVSNLRLDRREHCAFCQIGTFKRRAEHIVLSSNAKEFQEEYFAVWRCAFCRSIHSLAKFPLGEYYRHSPFLKRRLNSFNRRALEGFRRRLAGRGVERESRILFYGVNSAMFQAFFREKGYASFDVFEEVMNEERLAAQAPGAYDAVVVLDYLERAEEPRLVFEFAARQLRAGGKLIVHAADAEKIRLPFTPIHDLHQPFRLHIPSWTALESLAELQGFTRRSVERRSYLDTLIPFINFRTFQDLPFFVDGSLESAFSFRPRQLLRKVWRLPRFLFLGLFGGLWRDRSTVLAVFVKKA